MTDYYVDNDEYESSLDPGESASRPIRPRGSSSSIEGSGTWLYLLLLSVLCLALVGLAFACEDRTPSAMEVDRTIGEGSALGVGGPARLLIAVDGDIVTLDGVVPNEEVKQQIVQAAGAEYGSENVIDQLTISERVVVDDGILTITGRAASEDQRPAALQAAITSDLDFVASELAVTRSETGLAPMEIAARIDRNSVVLTGVAPDDATRKQLVDAADVVWSAENVDANALTVGASIIEGGQVTVSGSVLPGDERHLEFQRFLVSRFGSGLAVDVSAVGSSISAETLAQLETEIGDVVTVQPILFAPRSAEIDESSDAVVQQIAELLQEIPGVPVDIVGHTDDQGDPDENRELSRQRAEAVKARLQELGIEADLLNPRGEGQDFPIVDNDTPENRAKNRRIEFIVVGAAEGADSVGDAGVDGEGDADGTAGDADPTTSTTEPADG